jgi:hypothetical protein
VKVVVPQRVIRATEEEGNQRFVFLCHFTSLKPAALSFDQISHQGRFSHTRNTGYPQDFIGRDIPPAFERVISRDPCAGSWGWSRNLTKHDVRVKSSEGVEKCGSRGSDVYLALKSAIRVLLVRETNRAAISPEHPQ